MSDVTRMTAAQIAGLIAGGETSAVEVATAHLDRIAAVDDRVHAFLHVDTEGAVRAAEAVDRRRAAGEELGPLAGVPIAVKDVLTTRGVPTTAASKILEGWRPPYDSTVVERLRAAGWRIEPPVSVPMAHGARPPATAADEPPDEPPGIRSGFHGL